MRTTAFQASSKKENREEDDEEMALLTQKFKRFLWGERDVKRMDHDRKTSSNDEERKCFNCDRIGHIAINCRVKQSKGKKALAVTWDDDESDISDSKVSEFGFLASIENQSDIDDHDIYTTFENLFEESQKICLKNVDLKKRVIILEHENESLKNKITTLEEDLRKANSKVLEVNCNKKRKFSYNFFISSHNITCYYCSTKEHVWAHCPLRKNNKDPK